MQIVKRQEVPDIFKLIIIFNSGVTLALIVLTWVKHTDRCANIRLVLNRSTCQFTVPPCVAPRAPMSALKMTALLFCWLQTPAARALKRANTTTVTGAVAALHFLLFHLIPSLLCRASASGLAPKRARHEAALPALKRSGWCPPTPCHLPPSARSVLAALCLQVVWWLHQRPWLLLS